MALRRPSPSSGAVVCVAAVSPGAVAPVRYLVKRLRQRLPEVRIIVAAFGAADAADERSAITAAGVDSVGTTVVEARGPRYEPGQSVELAVPPDCVHLFDPATGVALR